MEVHGEPFTPMLFNGHFILFLTYLYLIISLLILQKATVEHIRSSLSGFWNHNIGFDKSSLMTFILDRNNTDLRLILENVNLYFPWNI